MVIVFRKSMQTFLENMVICNQSHKVLAFFLFSHSSWNLSYGSNLLSPFTLWVQTKHFDERINLVKSFSHWKIMYFDKPGHLKESCMGIHDSTVMFPVMVLS